MAKLRINERDRANELKAFLVVEQLWNCQILQTADESIVDGIAYQGRTLKALIEYKHRPSYHENMHYLYMSKKKIETARRISTFLKCKFLIVITNFEKRLLYIDVKSGHTYITQTFKRDRKGDKVEEIYLIPTIYLTPIEKIDQKIT